MEDPKESFQKLLEILNKFSEVIRSVNIQSQFYFYTLTMNNLKIELRKQFHFQ